MELKSELQPLRKPLKIAIDGPAGAGKSTVSRAVAERLNIKYLDTGAMYRAITLKIIRENVDISDTLAIETLLEGTEINFSKDNQVLLDGENVTAEIRLSDVNAMVSPVSALSPVRRRMVAIQQSIAKENDGIIMEGRDIASRVLTDADFKFYLDASIEERSKRRNLELKEKGIFAAEESVMQEISNRDSIDSTRLDSPLTIVQDAIVVDTTEMTFEEVVDKIVETVKIAVR